MYQCFGCNGAFSKKDLEKKCCVLLCVECSGLCKKCENCKKPLQFTMQQTVRERGSIHQLLERSPDQNCDEEEFERTAFDEAVLLGDIYFLKKLKKEGFISSNRKRTMDIAIRSGNTDIISFLKHNCFPFNYQTTLHLIDEFEYLDQYLASLMLDI